MTETVTKKQLLDIKTDMKLLLECMNYQKDNPSALKQALVTLSCSLQSCNEAKDIFRDTGGLQSVLDTVTTTKYGEVTEAGLYCLGSAVEKNVYSQKLLSTASTFTFLHSILSDEGSSVRKKRTAAFLILCLVSNNGFGQNLARESSCLRDIMSLIRTSLPGSTRHTSADWLDKQDGKSVALWCALVSTACVCVNNPLNEENQRICASLLPFLFSLLQHETSHKTSRPILSLVGLTVANNAQNQDRVRKCGGVDIFVKLLKKLVSKMDDDVESKTTAVQLLNTIDSCIADNEENARLVGKLGTISLMLKMLSERSLEDQEKTQIVLTLANSTDMYDGNKKYIKECGGITSLIQQLTLTENEELSKTVKYLLQLCVSSDNEGMVDIDENNNLANDEPLVANMERMKRQNDLLMLERINELDGKLRSMEKEAHQRQESNTQLQLGSSDFTVNSPGDRPQKSRSENSLPLSRMEVASEVQTPMTPRETSLLSQLDKERKEKERLEILNQMLQENMHVCLTHVAAKENCSKYESCQHKSGVQTESMAQIDQDVQMGQGARTRSYAQTGQGVQTGLGGQTGSGVSIGSGDQTCSGVLMGQCAQAGSCAQTGQNVQTGLGGQTGSGVQLRQGAQTGSGVQTRSSSNAQIGSGVQTGSVAKIGSNVQTRLNAQTGSSVQIGSVAQTDTIGQLRSEVLVGLRPQTGMATPSGDACSNTVQNAQMDRTDSRSGYDVPVDLSAKRNIFNTTKDKLETENVYSNDCAQFVTCQSSSTNVKSQKDGNTDFHNTNFYDQNNNPYIMKSQFMQSHPHNSETFSAVPLQMYRRNQTNLELQEQSAAGITCAPVSGTSKFNIQTDNADSRIHEMERQNSQKNAVKTQYSKNNSLSTTNMDRFLQIQNTQPFVRLERISATPCSQNQTTSQNKQNFGKASETVDNSCMSTENPLDISKSKVADTDDNAACLEPEAKKTKAKRLLLAYTKAVSKSTLTTPSLSNIASRDDAELNNNINSDAPKLQPTKRGVSHVKQTVSKTTETQTTTKNEILPQHSAGNQISTSPRSQSETYEKDASGKGSVLESQAANTPKRTEKKQQERIKSGSLSVKSYHSKVTSQPVSSEKYIPGKDMTVSKDMQEPFVKPRAPPPRRKVRVMPKLGSGKLPTFQRKQKEATAHGFDTDNSDVESEFDFELLKTAKQNRIQQFLETSNNIDDCSEISAKSETHTKTMTCSKRSWSKLNLLTLSSQSRCSDWSAIPVTPTKRQNVLPRPAFSDCGSRRPVFDSPISVKSVGRIKKRALDDSGIYSPEKGINVSPGASSLTGSSDSTSDLSSYFNNNPGDEHSQSRRQRSKQKKIAVYKKEEHCPGCQAPAVISGQVLNSRTYSIALETDPNTCLFHRKLRQYERLHIHQVKTAQKGTAGRLLDSLKSKIQRREKRKKTKTSVYEFESDITEQVSPASQSSDEGETQHYPSKHRQRRQRLEYTEDEEHNLLEGVRKMGKCWTQILATYLFHPSRTAVDLKDKYKSMTKSAENRSTRSSYSGRSRILKPFSMCEERRLRRGIKKFGYSWKTILEHFTFSRDRTAEDLRNRWRSMHRRGTNNA